MPANSAMTATSRNETAPAIAIDAPNTTPGRMCASAHSTADSRFIA
jgi:hypothetical protein